MSCIANACRKRAFSPSEHKTVSTIAAEVLGRLPPSLGAVDAHPALTAFLNGLEEHVEEAQKNTLADRARVALYALCKRLNAQLLLPHAF